MLAVLAVLAVHLHLDAMAADLSARSRAALRAADFANIEVAFNGREAMVRGHVANGLHMAAVETIIESQRGVRWADLRAVTVGAAPPVGVGVTPTSAPPAVTARVDAAVRGAQVARDAGAPADAGRDAGVDMTPSAVAQPETAKIDAGVIAAGDAAPQTPAAPDAPTDAPPDAAARMAPSAQVAARMHAVRGLDLFFGPDGVNLTEDGAAELAQIALILKGTAGAVRVESHTDNVGKPDTNQARSDARAAVVRDALQANGVSAARLHAVGRGAREPIADNSTQDGRALNRRIVITLDP